MSLYTSKTFFLLLLVTRYAWRHLLKALSTNLTIASAAPLFKTLSYMNKTQISTQPSLLSSSPHFAALGESRHVKNGSESFGTSSEKVCHFLSKLIVRQAITRRRQRASQEWTGSEWETRVLVSWDVWISSQREGHSRNQSCRTLFQIFLTDKASQTVLDSSYIIFHIAWDNFVITKIYCAQSLKKLICQNCCNENICETN